jgi:thiol-disulfide isomerase/thioredoxin
VPRATAGPLLHLPDGGPAPDFRNDVWINSEPLRLADLRGKVVLVEFWTFGCVNCQRVIPHVNAWYETYADEGFEVVGVHYPEFEYERDVDNVRAAVSRLEIGYPVAIDNDRLTWGAYNQRYWPTLYLLDKAGHIRYKHIGEGAYAETEAAIRELLAEPVP